MSKDRGLMKYIPREMLNELELIKQNNGIDQDVEAFREMTKYAKVGRETENLMNFLGLKKKRQ